MAKEQETSNFSSFLWVLALGFWGYDTRLSKNHMGGYEMSQTIGQGGLATLAEGW